MEYKVTRADGTPIPGTVVAKGDSFVFSFDNDVVCHAGEVIYFIIKVEE